MMADEQNRGAALGPGPWACGRAGQSALSRLSKTLSERALGVFRTGPGARLNKCQRTHSRDPASASTPKKVGPEKRLWPSPWQWPRRRPAARRPSSISTHITAPAGWERRPCQVSFRRRSSANFGTWPRQMTQPSKRCWPKRSTIYLPNMVSRKLRRPGSDADAVWI